MTANVPRNPGPASLAAMVAVVLGFLLIWAPPMLAGTDTPTHIAFAMLLANPEAGGGLIETSIAPTSQLFVWLAVPFASWGPIVAAKAAVSLTFAVHVSGAWLLARAIGGSPTTAVPIAVAAFFGFSFAMGFFNFTLAAGVGMALLALAVHVAREPSIGHGVMLAVLGAITLFAHVIVFGMFAVQALLLALFHVRREHLARSLGVLALALLPSAVVSLWVVVGVSTALADAGTAEGLGIQRLGWETQLRNVWYTSFGGLSPLAAFTALATLMLAATGAGGRARGVLLASLALWGVIYALVPFHMGGWAYAQPRALLPAVAMLIGYASLGRLPTRGALFALAVCTVQLASAWPWLRDEGVRSRSVLEALGTEPPGLSMIVRMDGGAHDDRPYIVPLQHVAHYVVGYGGVDPDWVGMNPVIHNVRAAADDAPDRVPPFIYVGRDCRLNRGCANFAQTVVDRAFVTAAPFSTILVTGASEDELRLFEARGFRRTAPARFAPPLPRKLELMVEITESVADQDLVARLSFGATIGPYAGVEIPAGPARQVGPILLGPVAEGLVMFEVVTDDGEFVYRSPIEVAVGAPELLGLTVRAESP